MIRSEQFFTNELSPQKCLSENVKENVLSSLKSARIVKSGLKMRITRSMTIAKPSNEEKCNENEFGVDKSSKTENNNNITQEDTDNTEDAEIEQQFNDLDEPKTQENPVKVPCMFQCTKCVKKFPRLQQLKQHQMVHSDFKPYPCTYCSRRFKKASHLKTHTLTHTDDSPYKCLECNKKFTQDASLKLHMLKHAGIRPFLCKHCGKNFPKLFTLQRHELIHSEEYQLLKQKEKNERLFERSCTDSDRYDSDKNERTYNSEFVKKVSEEFTMNGRLKNTGELKEIVRELNSDLKKLERDNNNETGHEKGDHIAPYLCEVIEGSEDANLNPDGKAFQCSKCFKRFSRLTYLKQHQTTHSDFKPYPCTKCPMRFKKPSHLKTHLLTHSDDSPYKCKVCNKNFTQDASLKSHLLAHSGIRPYGCMDCGKKFTKLYTLQRHELTHTEERPFQCLICFKKFSDISNLKRHEMTHSNNKPFNCLQCDKKFIQLTHLKRHRLTHQIKTSDANY